MADQLGGDALSAGSFLRQVCGSSKRSPSLSLLLNDPTPSQAGVEPAGCWATLLIAKLGQQGVA